MKRFVTFVVALLAMSGCSEPVHLASDGFDDYLAVLREESRIDGHIEELVPISAVAVRDDGMIAMVQRLDHAVRFFSSEGDLLGAFGRRGEGPGEFQAPMRIGWWADSLWVYDGLLGRVTVLSPTFELSRTLPTHLPFPMVPLAVDREATLIARRTLSGRSTIARISLDGADEGTLLILPEGQGESIDVPGVGIAYAMPFSNTPEYAAAPSANRAAMAMADLDGADAGTFLVTAVTLTADTIFSRRYGFSPEAIPDAEAERRVEAAVAIYARQMPEMASTVRREIWVPPVYPPFTDLLIGSDGTIWIEHRIRTNGQLYSVIASDGSPIGTLVLADGNRLAAAQLDRIWVVEPDELGVESLVRYAVAWSED